MKSIEQLETLEQQLLSTINELTQQHRQLRYEIKKLRFVLKYSKSLPIVPAQDAVENLRELQSRLDEGQQRQEWLSNPATDSQRPIDHSPSAQP
jgi:hypothetical protein